MQPPGGWSDYLLTALGIEWYRIPVVIASAVIIYLAFLLLVRIFGARILTVTSGFDALVFIMLGAVAGRVILGHPIEQACRRTHTSASDLRAAMRRAGIAHPGEVQCIILEPHGDYSVIRAGAPLAPEMFTGVVGGQEHLFGEQR